MRLNEIQLFWRASSYSEENIKLMTRLKLLKHNEYNPDKSLYRISWVLDKMCLCITDLITRFMYDVNLPFRKLVINIWDKEIDDGIKIVTGCLGIQDVRIVYNPWKFFEVDDLEKKR